MRPTSIARLAYAEAEAWPILSAGTRAPAHDAPALSHQDHGAPVTFGGTVGFLYPGSAAVGVLMLSAIGYEEFCVRTTWHGLAQRLSAAGIPCLRFDPPGTGDALDPERPPAGLEDWRHAAGLAADLLRAATGVGPIVVVGHGLGGALAALWAGDLGGVDACVLMAPVGNGRRYLRELAIWAHIVDDRIGLPHDPEDGAGCAVAGFALPPGRVAAIRALDLASLKAAPASHALVVARAGVPGDEAVAAHLAVVGAAVTRLDYLGHEALTVDPSTARPPAETLGAVTDWIAARATAREASRDRRGGVVAASRTCPPLRGDGWSERPLRFGPGGRLFGVVCEPAAQSFERAAILVGAGRDYHIGWGRMTVDQARALAKRGIASLRFDAGGMGDSPRAADGPSEVLYSQAQIDDIRAAVDLMEAAGYRAIALVGRCSGAFAAFNAAVDDRRVGHVVAINAPRLVWDPDESVEDALRYAHRSLGDFGATFLKRDGFRRLLTGRLRVAAGLRHVAGRLARAASERLAPVLGPLTRQGRLHREVHHRMAVLASQGARLSFVFSHRDPGLPDLFRRFGRGARGLAAYAQTSLVMIEEADHNFTHAGARSRLLDVLVAALAP